MKRNIFAILFAALAVMGFTSCEDYFDDVPNNAETLDDVFANRGRTLAWLNNVYSYLPDDSHIRYTGGTSVAFVNMASIEGYLPWTDGDNGKALTIINGSLNSSTGLVRTLWQQYYRGIANANIYLANVDKCEIMPAEEREWTKAECRALRAYFYYNLVKLFGPVSIVGDEVFSVDDPLDKMAIARSSVDECFDYIIAELDAALASGHLRNQFDANGRSDASYNGNMTVEMVQGIRAMTYMLRASFLFNGDPNYMKMANKDGKGLFPQERSEQKWRDAKAALETVMAGPYKLTLRDNSGKLVDEIKQSNPYYSITYSTFGTNNEEMVVYRTGSDLDQYPLKPRFATDPSYGGGGAYSIPLQFVDMFFTNKGLRIEEDTEPNTTANRYLDPYFTYDDKNPQNLGARSYNPESLLNPVSMTYNDVYATDFTYFNPVAGKPIMKQFYNREPRFYADVTFNNRPWHFHGNMPVELNMNGNSGSDGQTHDFPVYGTIVQKLFYEEGYDNWNRYFVVYRLAEVYLNYAECCAELGDFETAIEYVNKVRARAGIAEYKTSPTDNHVQARAGQGHAAEFPLIQLPAYDQKTVLKAIYRETILELAYEAKHYFNVRRWGVADGKWRHQEEMTDGWLYPTWHKGGEGGVMKAFNVQNKDYSADYSNVNFYKRLDFDTRIYNDRNAFFPIPEEEVKRNYNMVQNWGWTVEDTNE